MYVDDGDFDNSFEADTFDNGNDRDEEITPSAFIATLKDELVNQMVKVQKMPSSLCEYIVERLLPEKNFYFYKASMCIFIRI